MSWEIVRANSVRSAASVLAGDGAARFLGGGTLVVRDANCGDLSIGKLVLCDGLDGIAVENGRAEIGGGATMAKVAGRPELGFLHAVAGAIGGPAVRAMATVGGNLFAPYPYGDFTVALLALCASVTVEGTDRTETLDLEAFLADGGRAARVVRSVAFEVPAAGAFRFAKVVRRKPHGAAVLSIAAVLPMADGKIAGARIAYGAMAAMPIRARAVEQAIEGRPLDDLAIAAAEAVALEGCAPQTDPFASAWYRRAVLPVHLKRLLGG
jgi:CO/xanthine dehydrogenase FAD-binding subunit